MILNSWIDSSVGVASSVMFEPTSTFETPSTSQLTALRRPPLIERLTTLVSPMPTSSLEVARDAGDQRRQLHEVPVVERQLLDLRRAHEGLNRGGRLNELLTPRSPRRFRLRPRRVCRSSRGGRSTCSSIPFDRGLESRQRERHLVRARLQRGRQITASFIRNDLGDASCFDLFEGDRHPGRTAPV